MRTVSLSVQVRVVRPRAAFETALGIKAGQVTDDGRFLLDTQNCLKQCGSAPNTRIDNDLFKQVAPDLVPEILAQYP